MKKPNPPGLVDPGDPFEQIALVSELDPPEPLFFGVWHGSCVPRKGAEFDAIKATRRGAAKRHKNHKESSNYVPTQKQIRTFAIVT